MQDDKWTMTPETPWPYGTKYKGIKVRELPVDYLIWVYENFHKGSVARKACARQIALRAPDVAEEVSIQGRHDCSHLFRPDIPWPEEIPWDGVSPPFEVDDDELSQEYREIVG